MQKQMLNKKIIICICAVAIVAAAAVLMFLFNKEETFRSILVYEVEGTAVIEREDVGDMDAVENLYLESGDRVSVAHDSGMRMKLDDDKYVMAEADTIFSVEAEGTDADSKTRICLEQGAITNEIQHPLSEGSQYETSTPNSVMAVRGTIYRAEIYIDENGDKNTKLCCFQGKVGTTPILPDGTYGEEILVPAGSELIIYSDGSVDGPRDITYEELPVQALQNLRSMSESGQSMTGITLEDLTALTDQMEDSSEEPEESEPEEAVTSEAAEDSEKSDTDENAEADEDKAVAGNTPKSASAKTDKGAEKPEASQMTAEQAEQKTQPAENTQPKVPQSASSSSGSDNGDGDSSQSGDNGGGSDNNNRPDHGGSDNNRPSDYTPVLPPPVVTYTVTFEYQGDTFATQQVKSGEKASEPILIPDQNGEWDFDFGTVIQADTTVKWKDNT
ncbi:MAG: FecR domain-containing protein [Lachnospiraceae bacterium]|nr:FecR domain-containing protein [Lachnospiraceae bacterium]